MVKMCMLEDSLGNIRTVQKREFNSKVLADFEKPLAEEFFDCGPRICSKQKTKPGISIRINDLNVVNLPEYCLKQAIQL